MFNKTLLAVAACGAAVCLPLSAKDSAPAKTAGKSASTLSTEAIPPSLTARDLDGSNPEFLAKYFILNVFPQKMQIADNHLTQTEGRVLVIQKGTNMIVAFYRPDNNAFVLAGKPTVLSAVVPPRSDVHPTNGLPCVVVRRQGTNDAWRIYLKSGKVINEPFVDETSGKEGK